MHGSAFREIDVSYELIYVLQESERILDMQIMYRKFQIRLFKFLNIAI